MPMIFSDADAALLEAHRMSEGLARRYAHATEDLLPEGQLRSRLEARSQALKAHAGKLEVMIRKRDLLPRDAHTEMADLKQLGDSFVNWIDETAAETLCESFAEEEAALVMELEQARKHGIEGLDEAIAAAREAAGG